MTDLACCIAEQGRCKAHLDKHGHDDGAWQGVTDWLMEEAILRLETIPPSRRGPSGPLWPASTGFGDDNSKQFACCLIAGNPLVRRPALFTLRGQLRRVDGRYSIARKRTTMNTGLRDDRTPYAHSRTRQELVFRVPVGLISNYHMTKRYVK